MYLVIDDDERASIALHPSPASRETVRSFLRGDTMARHNLPPHMLAAAWVADNGHSDPAFRRNVVASVVCHASGGAPYPLSGPVIITGYNPDNRTYGGPEPILAGATMGALVTLYLAVLEANAMPRPIELEVWRNEGFVAEFADTLRDAYAQFAEAPLPTLTGRAYGFPRVPE